MVPGAESNHRHRDFQSSRQIIQHYPVLSKFFEKLLQSGSRGFFFEPAKSQTNHEQLCGITQEFHRAQSSMGALWLPKDFLSEARLGFAVIYPASACGSWRTPALMESEDRRPITPRKAPHLQ
jgi:hypothetical protein